jgi:prepilin-type N-terminal cleavage/methylation domain-containing protein
LTSRRDIFYDAHKGVFYMKMFNKTGFSLPELMIVVAIVGIVSAIAAPNYMNYMAERRLKGAAWMVMSDLMAARAKAVSQNITVTVTFTSNYGYTITGEAAARDIRNDFYSEGNGRKCECHRYPDERPDRRFKMRHDGVDRPSEDRCLPVEWDPIGELPPGEPCRAEQQPGYSNIDYE